MTDNGRSWLWRRWRALLVLLVAAVVGWSGFSYWQEYSETAAKRARALLSPTVGQMCWVIYRNAETGIEAANFGPASVNGIENSVRGTFVKLNDEWIVLQAANQEQLWIPREHVLLMRVE